MHRWNFFDTIYNKATRATIAFANIPNWLKHLICKPAIIHLTNLHNLGLLDKDGISPDQAVLDATNVRPGETIDTTVPPEITVTREVEGDEPNEVLPSVLNDTEREWHTVTRSGRRVAQPTHFRETGAPLLENNQFSIFEDDDFDVNDDSSVSTRESDDSLPLPFSPIRPNGVYGVSHSAYDFHEAFNNVDRVTSQDNPEDRTIQDDFQLLRGPIRQSTLWTRPETSQEHPLPATPTNTSPTAHDIALPTSSANDDDVPVLRFIFL